MGLQPSCVTQNGAPMEKSIYSQHYTLFLGMLRTRRESAGITQREIAARLGATQSFVSKCERGERRLDIVELRAWCAALEISLNEFAVRFDEDCLASASQLASRKAKR